MKKIFTLFAVALVSLCAVAQEDGPCPSKLFFNTAEEDQPANKVTMLLQLQNSSENLNGFNMEVAKCLDEGAADDQVGEPCDAIQWLLDEDDEEYVGFSGYGATILARWEGQTDTQREKKLFQKCDLKCSVKEDTHNLVIIEILSTNDCRFFPVLETPETVARFTVDLSACADGEYYLVTASKPEMLSFSYTGGVEGTRAWTGDKIVAKLNKVGDNVRQVYDAISTVEVDQQVDNRIFDIMGRELQTVPEHGIYIQNGKKYVK
jgi:hypothetical protein